jgi:hypothetical protein
MRHWGRKTKKTQSRHALRNSLEELKNASVSSDRRAQTAWWSVLQKMRIRSGETVMVGEAKFAMTLVILDIPYFFPCPLFLP